MCGIAGILRFDDRPIGDERLTAMLDHLRHRGPDGDGMVKIGRCSLAHTRLSIIDLPDGAQPMTMPRRGDQGPLTVVFNGEIYNHRDLRRQLESQGHRFISDHSDTEVLLHGYRQWGTDLPARLEGMFAFAIWDVDASTLFLVRDRTGKKPLYVWRRDGEMMFASLVATLLRGRGERGRPAIDPQAMLMFLRLGYTGHQSLIAGIAEIPPAHWLSVAPDGVQTLHRYWSPPAIAPGPTEDVMAMLTSVLEQAVAQRLEADVPLGCFLSGGIDSSVVAALAQRQLRSAGGEALRTFSVKMPALDFDESAHARAMANHIGANHRELVAEPGSVADDLGLLVRVSGEPTADSSILPTYWLSRATRGHVKVAISGDGGDELFAGYDRYRAIRLLAGHRWWLHHVPAGFFGSVDPRSRRTRFRRLLDAARCPEPARQYQSMIHLFSDGQIPELSPALAGQCMPPYAPVPDWPREPDVAASARQWDFQHYLPMDLLRKVDRASMAVAMEVRCPLLATAVCDFVSRLSTEQLTAGGRPKALLRRVAEQLAPASIVRRPKRGFAIPIGLWLRGSLRDPLHEHLFGGSLESLGFDCRAILRYYIEHTEGRIDHSHRLFALLDLAIWSAWLDDPV